MTPRLIPTQWVVLVLVLLTGSPALAQKILLTDTDDFPNVRLYMGLTTEWPGGTATASFDERADPALVLALEQARKRVADAATTKTPLNWTVPPVPAYETAGTVRGFGERNDEAQGLLVVLVIDASYSMKGTGFARSRAAINGLLGALKPVDRVVLARIAGGLDILVRPTTDRAAITTALDDLQEVKSHAHIYDSLAKLLQDTLKRETAPTLPGRRLLMLFSDGRDAGSTLKVDDFENLFGKLHKRPTMITVGVGPPGERHKDLTRLATFAGNVANFVSAQKPDRKLPKEEREQRIQQTLASDLAAVLTRNTTDLKRQVRVDFEVPTFYWRQWSDPALKGRITLAPTAGAATTAPLALTLKQPLAGERGAAHQALIKSLKNNKATLDAHDAAVIEERKKEIADREVKTREAERATSSEDEKQNNMLYLGIAGAVLLLLMLLGLMVSRRRKKDREHQGEALQHMGDDLRQELERDRKDRVSTEEAVKKAADQARHALAVLITLEGPMKGRRFAILTPSCVAGREAAQCDLAFPEEDDGFISRQHARFQYGEGPGAFQVACLSSTGMSVNGVELRQGDRYPIQFGQQLKMGDSLFTLERP